MLNHQMPKSEAEVKTHPASPKSRLGGPASKVKTKDNPDSFSQMVEVVCYCQWHRMFFLESDFMEQTNQKKIHFVLDKHAKNDHPYEMPFFNVRAANLKNNKFELIAEY